MNEGKTTDLTPSSPFGETLLQGWLSGGEVAAPLDQWIFWNNSPSRHVPLGTLTKFFPEKFYHILEKDQQVRSQVDALLRSKLSWSEAVAWNPEDPLWEIALLAPARLQRFAFLAAALSMKEMIAKIIDGALVRKLRQEIGADIIEFVILSGSLSKYSFEECTLDFACSEDALITLRQRALLLLENAFSGKELGVQQRIASKVPGTFSIGLKTTPSPLAGKTEEMFHKLWKETKSWV